MNKYLKISVLLVAFILSFLAGATLMFYRHPNIMAAKRTHAKLDISYGLNALECIKNGKLEDAKIVLEEQVDFGLIVLDNRGYLTAPSQDKEVLELLQWVYKYRKENPYNYNDREDPHKYYNEELKPSIEQVLGLPKKETNKGSLPSGRP